MKAPQWGKVTGILMIIFASLGIFYQGYKLIIPSILRMQSEMWNTIDTNSAAETIPQRQLMGSMQNMMEISTFHENVLIYSGLIGLIVCVLYIIGGVKMLKKGVNNLKFGKVMLASSLTYNVVVAILMYSGARTMMTIGLTFYGVIGLVIDVVLLIIVLASDSSGYDPNATEEMEDLTLHAGSDEIL